MFIGSFCSGPWQANCYLVRRDDSNQVVAIDPGVDAREIIDQVLAEREWQLAGVLATHGHVDHIADAARVANAAAVPLWLHSGDNFMLTTPSAGLGADSFALLTQVLGADELPAPDRLIDLAGIDAVEVAGLRFTVTPAPGHSPGCVVFTQSDEVLGDTAFCGDLIFAGSIGRTDLPGGDPQTMVDSLRRVVLPLPDGTQLLPGHGPTTTVGREKVVNPYLQQQFLES